MAATAEQNRRRAAVREAATRAFLADFEGDYDLLMARSLGTGKSWDARRRAAAAALRTEHPDEWLAALATAKKEHNDG